MPRAKKQKLMKERGSPRGLVPTAHYGRFDEPFNAYLGALDPRGDSDKSQAMRHALATSTDARFQVFLQRVQDPQYKRYSLATIAKHCDLTLPLMAEFWQKAQKVRALAIAQDGIVSFIPDMVTESHGQTEPCMRCDGFGFVFSEDGLPGTRTLVVDKASRPIRTCPACKGTGLDKKPGNQESRKMLLEVAGLAGRSSGARVTLNQTFGAASVESAVNRLNRVSFEVGEEDGSVIDVEPGKE